jgi:hypothetical protein
MQEEIKKTLGIGNPGINVKYSFYTEIAIGYLKHSNILCDLT